MQSGPILLRMNALVNHRGPDGSAYVSFSPAGRHWIRDDFGGSIGLGHTRLSIIDLSRSGQQPMAGPENCHWLIFNGEIYNHIELRQELQKLGHVFLSSSDSEVLLHAFIQWGKLCLEKLNGIFAFVIFDKREGKVFVARDRFGVKPLYYWHGPDGIFAIASEIKQFTVLPGWTAAMNGSRAYDFLNWNLTDHTAETMFSGVMQLRGGQMFDSTVEHLRNGEARPQSWYTLKPNADLSGLGDRDATQKFLELFMDSTRLQLRADVPVGSCLSGGLDSSSIVCISRKILELSGSPIRQHTFSARSAISAYDEGAYIRQVVDRTGVHSHEVIPDLESLFRLLPNITWHQDEPFGSTSIYAQWHVFSLARKHGIKVMLDGQGADEILAGYHGFFGPRLASLLREGRWAALWHEMRMLRQHHGYSLSFGVSRIADVLMPPGIRQLLRKASGKPAGGNNAWLDLHRLGCAGIDPFDVLGARQRSVNALSLSQIVSTNLPMLLHSEDRNSMAHGVEARVPFLDHRLVEFSLGLAEDKKISEGVTKRILRNAMVDVLPEPVRTRMDKLGFVTPEEVWVRETAPALFRKKLGEAVEISNGIFKPTVITHFDEMLARKRPFSHQWWRVISFGSWLDKFSVETT